MNLLALTARLDRLEQLTTSETKTAPAAAAGVTTTCNAAANFVKGAYAQIVPAAGITTRFRPSAIVVDNPSAADEYEIQLAKGAAAAEVVVCTIKVTGAGRYPINCDYVEANTRIAARAGCLDAVARTIGVTIEYADNLI